MLQINDGFLVRDRKARNDFCLDKADCEKFREPSQKVWANGLGTDG